MGHSLSRPVKDNMPSASEDDSNQVATGGLTNTDDAPQSFYSVGDFIQDLINANRETNAPAVSDAASFASSSLTLVPDEERNQQTQVEMINRSTVPATQPASSGTRATQIEPQHSIILTPPTGISFYQLYHISRIYRPCIVVDPSLLLTFASLIIPPPVMSTAAQRRAVDFSATNTVIMPDGTTEMQPATVADATETQPVDTTDTQSVDTTETSQEEAKAEAQEATATESPPPGGPPSKPPTTPAATPAPEPDDNNGVPPAATAAVAEPGASAPPQNQHARVPPPVGARAQAAMANQNPPIIIMAPSHPQPQPLQAVSYINSSQLPQMQQSYLLVNPPMVAPSVPPPMPGNTGSWCYPNQSPFWTGPSHWQQTAPQPQLYIQQQGYVAEPGYVVTYPAREQEVPRLRTWVDSRTGQILYYHG